MHHKLFSDLAKAVLQYVFKLQMDVKRYFKINSLFNNVVLYEEKLHLFCSVQSSEDRISYH